MKRTNTFAVRPLTDEDEQVLRDLLDASAALWNEINYERLMRYNDEDGFEGEDVWGADTGALEGKYKDVLGASTAQTVRRANTEAWRSFFENKKAYHNESNTSVTEHPEPRYLSGSPVGSMDQSRVPAVRFDRPDDTASGHARLSVWVRGARRPYGFRNVPETAHREGSQADGTARAVRVGRPQLVGDTRPSGKSQRTAHRPEYRPP
ncbi:MAG: hypothetical protein ACI9PP_001853 [Halobacteriales archaeon]|jgi:hypothetical protein